MQKGFRRYIPGLIVILVAGFLMTVYLPPWLELISFKSSLNRFIKLIKTGKIYQAADFVDKDEYDEAISIIERYVQRGYEREIAALNVSSISGSDKAYVSVLVLRLEGENYHWAGRVRLYFKKTREGWRFRISEIEVGQLLTEDWVNVRAYLGEEMSEFE